MKSEPKPRLNGRCYVCKKKISVPKHVAPDAFCSTGCCRSYFGTALIIAISTSS